MIKFVVLAFAQLDRMAMTTNGCIQFTRHPGDVLLNFNRLRSRNMLTDVTIQVDGQCFPAHKAILVACRYDTGHWIRSDPTAVFCADTAQPWTLFLFSCSGFFYSVFMEPENKTLGAISLDPKVDPKGLSILLDFMYTSYLNLQDNLVLAIMNTAIYLQMEHVVDTCQRFIKSR